MSNDAETIQYKIVADVVDLRKDTPRKDDFFLIDTMVWYWMTYTRASLVYPKPRFYQTLDYPDYLKKGLGVDAKFYRCALSFAELAHLIERKEMQIFANQTGKIEPKVYRHNYPIARQDMVEEMRTVWGQVRSMSSSLDIAIDDGLVEAACKRFENECVDGYDLFLLEAMSKAGVIQLITDDGDFSTVAGIAVFTANENVINAAQEQGKLIRR